MRKSTLVKFYQAIPGCAVLLIISLFFVCRGYADNQTTSSTLASVIVDQAREYLNDPTTYGGTQKSIWSDAELLQYLNDGTMTICKAGVLQDTEVETLVENQVAYTLSDSFIKVLGVVYDDTKPLILGSFEAWAETEEHGTPGYWMPWKSGVIVYPAPNSDAAGKDIDVYVAKRPTSVAADATVLVPAQYDLALVYFITAQAVGGKDNMLGRSVAFLGLFAREMAQ